MKNYNKNNNNKQNRIEKRVKKRQNKIYMIEKIIFIFIIIVK